MKTIHYKILPVIVFFFTIIAFGQLENANWYFGQNGAGLNFNGATPVPVQGATTNITSHTATASDTNGNLLFYTDGASVWNKNHIKMPNGNNTLNGPFNSVLTVPFPGDSNKYYIFTIFSNQYYYSVININLNNGLGDIESFPMSLNILPYFVSGDNGFRNKIERKNNMIISRHADEESYWLILNPFDKMFTLKIDVNGISAPIISDAVGSYNFGAPSTSQEFGSAGMSISSNQQKIAFFRNVSITGSGLYSEANIYNFNNSTGTINYDTAISNNLFGLGVSVEFSPDSNYLYLYNGNSIYQSDLNNPSTDPVLLHSFETSGDGIYVLRLAIDGKIYVTNPDNHITNNRNYLSVINNPNVSGLACGFVENQLDLNGGSAKLLPHLTPTHTIGCKESRIIINSILNGQIDLKSASHFIHASNIIESGATAVYDAGNNVLLLPNFHAKAGASFKAYIDGCDASSSFSKSQQTKTTTLKQIENTIKSYPNPTTGLINITSSQNIVSWQLSNLLGRAYLDRKKYTNIKGFSLNLSSYPSGIYILRTKLENGDVVIKKIIKK